MWKNVCGGCLIGRKVYLLIVNQGLGKVMVIVEHNDYISELIKAESALKEMKQNLLENDLIKAYGYILITLTALRHVRDKIVAQNPPNSGLELQQH